MAHSIGIMPLPSGVPNAHTTAGPLEPPYSRRFIGHDLTDRRQDLAMAHTASARGEARCTNRHDAEQQAQLPRAPVLQRPLRAASRATASATAIFLRLGLNEMTLQLRQQQLGLRQRQAQGLGRTGGQGAAADMQLVY